MHVIKLIIYVIYFMIISIDVDLLFLFYVSDMCTCETSLVCPDEGMKQTLNSECKYKGMLVSFLHWVVACTLNETSLVCPDGSMKPTLNLQYKCMLLLYYFNR